MAAVAPEPISVRERVVREADLKRFDDYLGDKAGCTSIDVELGGNFTRVRNLLWIQENEFYREALADWEAEKKSLDSKFDRREKRSEELTNQIYNLVGFFSVFQGVLLTAVTQLSAQSTQATPATQAAGSTCTCTRPLCGKVWFPIVLSFLAAIAASIGIALKFRDLHVNDVLIHDDKLKIRDAEEKKSNLINEGERFTFKKLRIWDTARRVTGKGSLLTHWSIKPAVVICGVLVFSTIFILSFFVILCDKWVVKSWQ